MYQQLVADLQKVTYLLADLQKVTYELVPFFVYECTIGPFGLDQRALQ